MNDRQREEKEESGISYDKGRGVKTREIEDGRI